MLWLDDRATILTACLSRTDVDMTVRAVLKSVLASNLTCKAPVCMLRLSHCHGHGCHHKMFLATAVGCQRWSTESISLSVKVNKGYEQLYWGSILL